MTDIQIELYELLKIFDGICKSHDIEYFLTGGSALGAIRHNGFIPWDDDIDIGMSKSMWDTLKPILTEELPKGIVLVCNEDYPTYHNPVVRIVNTKSARLTKAALADGCPKGQFLEIFIHDPVPIEKKLEHKELFGLYCELNSPYMAILQQKFRALNGLKDDEIAIIDEYFRIKRNCTDVELQNLLSEMEENLTKYIETESDYYLLRWGTTTRYYPIEHFAGIRYEIFEELDVPIPIKACSNLRIDYRNEWTDFPKKEAQTAPHVTVGVSGVSGEEYMRLINEEISLEETNAMRLSIKEFNLTGLKDRIERNKIMFGIKMKIAQDIESRSGDIKILYRNCRYDDIIERFRSYTDLKRQMLNYSITEDIRHETKEVLASALVLTGRLTDAENVMGIDRTQNPAPENSAFVNDMLYLAKSVPEYYDGFFAESKDMLNNVRSEWHKSIVFRKMSARLDLVGGTVPRDIYRLFEEFPNDTEVAKLTADAMLLEGRKDEAKNIYWQLLENGKNGMDILDIKKKIEV